MIQLQTKEFKILKPEDILPFGKPVDWDQLSFIQKYDIYKHQRDLEHWYSRVRSK